MVLQQFTPSVALTDFVRVYRLVHFVFDQEASLPFKPYPPKPEHCLSFYPRDTETVEYVNNGLKIQHLKTVLMGQQTELTKRYVGRDFLVFQVVFSPGGLYRLTGIPNQLLNNSYMDAETIFTKDIKTVNDQLNEAVGTKEMVLVIEKFLLKQINRKIKSFHQIDQVCNKMLRAENSLSMEWLAKVSCLSLRQFERKFIERMGVSPRYFNKVVRFENAFRMKNATPQQDWLSIAIRCGYHDYQHLSKDYKALTNQSPIQFHLLDNASPERIFGESDTY